jgi:hypothetical protein
VAKLQLGKEEKLACIVDVSFRGPEGEKLCLAYKTTTLYVGAGVYATDDGYVLRAVGQTVYYSLDEGRIAALQESGQLPRPLPPYEVPTITWVMGFSLWWAIGLVAGIAWIQHAVARRRLRLLEVTGPPTLGPPALRTKTDRWLNDQVSRLLERDETIQHQAYATDRELRGLRAAAAKGFYVALTDRRLVVIESRVGAFGPLHEVGEVRIWPRTEVMTVGNEGFRVSLRMADQSVVDLWLDHRDKHMSNQAAFARDVPRLLEDDAAEARKHARQKKAETEALG